MWGSAWTGGQTYRLPHFFVNEQQIPRWLNLSQLLIG